MTDWEADTEAEPLTLPELPGEIELDTEGVEVWELATLVVIEVLGVEEVLLLPHALEEKLTRGEEVRVTTAVAVMDFDTLPVMDVLGVEVVLLLAQALGVKLTSGVEVPLRLTVRVAVTEWEGDWEGEPLTLLEYPGETELDTEGVEVWEPTALAVMEVLGVVVVLLLPQPLDEGLAKGEEVKDTTAVADVVSDTLLVLEVLGVEVVLLLTQAVGV